MPKKATDDSGPISNLGHSPRRPDKDESGHKTKFDGREQQTLKVGQYVFNMSLKCVFFSTDLCVAEGCRNISGAEILASESVLNGHFQRISSFLPVASQLSFLYWAGVCLSQVHPYELRIRLASPNHNQINNVLHAGPTVGSAVTFFCV